jgi:hypothetical protein
VKNVSVHLSVFVYETVISVHETMISVHETVISVHETVISVHEKEQNKVDYFSNA